MIETNVQGAATSPLKTSQMSAASQAAADVHGIVEAAERVEPCLRDMGLAGRTAMLRQIADAIDAGGAELARVADGETGLGLARMRGEAARTANQFRLMADVLSEGSLLDLAIDRAIEANRPGGPRPDLRRMSRPIGPVAVYAASNFPLAFGIAGTDTAAALAAGCPVIAKAHPDQPNTAKACAVVVEDVTAAAGLPFGTLQVTHGFDAGVALIGDPGIKAAAFTGSLGGGRALWSLACSRPEPIPFYGELGSINPVVLTPQAARDRGEAVAEQLATSILLGSGQFCTQPGFVIVPAGRDGRQIIAILGEAISTQPAHNLLGPRLAETYRKDEQLLRDTPETTLVAAGAPVENDAACGVQAQLWHIAARDVAAAGKIALREYFGPLALIVSYTTTTELEELLAAMPGSLTISVHSGPGEHALARRLYELAAQRAGRVLGAGVPTGVAVSWAQHHGGPWPATTHAAHTSVGAASIRRFLRPVAYQDVPAAFLPPELADDNPLRLVRRVDGVLGTEPLG